jgi:hypothetical protein
MVFMTRKAAFGLAYVATLGVVVGVLLVLMRSVVGPLASTIFSTQYGGWLGLAFPPTVTASCITAITTLWAACTLYSWQREALRLSASA